MTFIGRLILSVILAFVLFPVLYVQLGSAAPYLGNSGSVVVYFFLQFITPFAFIPLIAGILIALLWQFIHLITRGDVA